MRKIFALVISILLFINVLAQEQKPQEPKKIELVHSNTLKTLPEYGNDIQFLQGQVILAHDSSIIYCDSAVYNVAKNRFKAYRQVRIVSVKGRDTVLMRCDSLWYLGDSSLATAMGQIVLEKDSVVLYTDSLIYDFKNDEARFYKGGTIINADRDTLISDIGIYFTKDKKALFKDNVKIFSHNYKIFSDTLVHDLNLKISYFYGPTHIYGDTTYIYCEKGYYDHKNRLAVVKQRAKIAHKDQVIIADEINYDRDTKIGEAIGNIQIIDTANSSIILGQYGKFYQTTKRVFVSGDATLIQYDENDTIWIRSDTLLSYIDTLYEDKDTFIFRKVIAYHYVKEFHKNLQAKADSVVYSFLDSTIYMYGEPVLWSDSIQMYAQYAILSTVKGEPYQLILLNDAYIIEHYLPETFNQIFGKKIIVNFKNREIYRVDVLSEAKAIYFIAEDSVIIGINQIQCDTFYIFVKDKKVSSILAIGKPSGKIVPPAQATHSDMFLEGFKWFEEYRPRSPEDIYIWRRE